MGGQLDGIFLAGSLPHEFIILIVASFICLWLINFSLSLSLSLSLSMFRTPICRCEPPTLSLAECHRKRMVVVCTELLLALKHVLRQLPDTVERLAPSRCRRLAGNATYQLHANSTSGRSEKPGQHRCNPSVEARSVRSLQNISTAVILYYYCCFV